MIRAVRQYPLVGRMGILMTVQYRELRHHSVVDSEYRSAGLPGQFTGDKPMGCRAAHHEGAAVQVEQSVGRIGIGCQNPFTGDSVHVGGFYAYVIRGIEGVLEQRSEPASARRDIFRNGACVIICELFDHCLVCFTDLVTRHHHCRLRIIIPAHIRRSVGQRDVDDGCRRQQSQGAENEHYS